VCFYRGCHEEFKDFFSLEDDDVFCNDVCSVMEVLGHEYNPDQCACSLIYQKWAWRWFHSTMEIDSPLFLWLMQPTWRNVMREWSYCWERLSMMNLSGSYLVISSCGTITRNEILLHKILLFPVRVGQPGQEESLCK